jgi:hypothetical protein
VGGVPINVAAGQLGREREEQLVEQACSEQLRTKVRPALAQQRPHGEALAQLRQRRGQVEQPVALGTHVVDLGGARGEARRR